MSTTSILSTDSGAVSLEKINGNFASVIGGPSSSTDNTITRFDGASGKTVQDSAIQVKDYNGSLNIVTVAPINNAGAGYHLDIVGGAATSGDSNGGDVYLEGGTKNGSGSVGQVRIKHSGNDYGVFINAQPINTSHKTLTTPNRTGYIAVTSTTNIDDDAAISITPPYQYGTLVISMQTDNGGAYGGVINFTAESGGQVYTTKWAGGANLNVSTGSLLGTTGTDTKVTVSANTDGKVYVENRGGSTRAFIITLI